MATKIRLARGGAKKRPFYRIVVADVRSPRDGNFIEKIGTYNPLLDAGNPERLVIKKDRAEYWLGTGATPTERILSLFEAAGINMVTNNQKALAAKKVKSIELSKERKAAEEKKKAEEARKAEEKAKKEAAANEAAA